MAQGFGHNSWAAFGEEVTYGTAVAATDFLEIMTESLRGEHSYLSKPALRSPSQKNRVISRKNVTGGFNFQAGITGWELLLKHAMGAVNTTGAGPYTHDFTLAALPVGLSVVLNRDADGITGTSAFRYEGLQVQKLTLTQEIEDFLMVGVEFVGEDWSNIAKPSPTFPTFSGFDWADTAIVQIDPDGTPINPNVRRLELSIENSLADDRFKLGQRTRTGLGRQAQRIISGSIEIEFDTIDTYAIYRDLVDHDLAISWLKGAHQLTFEMPNVSFHGGEPTVDGPGPILMTLEFTAYQLAADNDEMTATWINATASI